MIIRNRTTKIIVQKRLKIFASLLAFTHYYISSGLGIWGGKFRIGTQSEYVVTTLRNEPQKPLSIHHTFLY